ncbi:hypothetical protein WR25_16833 [Diploscapter pachys]|uniref:Regulatory protein zeste n=1 Tax=Diploscapter pachys TaxID=2018661 RepID=A0A2A2LYM8_9BILA|nr:hypothetical protein WR25_16833 [Diploscapter pachys]
MEKLILMMQRPERLSESFAGNQQEANDDSLLQNGSLLLNGTSNMEFADADRTNFDPLGQSSSSASSGSSRNLDPRERKLSEKIEFAKIVSRHKYILFGDCDGIEVTPRTKEEEWKRVAAEVEVAGLESYKGKPWSRLRDHDWQYVRRHAMSRSEGLHKPTGRLGELDRIVLDIVFSTQSPSSVHNQQHIQQLVAAASANDDSNRDTDVERMLFQIIDPKNHQAQKEDEKNEHNLSAAIKSEFLDHSAHSVNSGMQVEEEDEDSERATETAQNDSITGPNLISNDPSKDLLEILTQQANSMSQSNDSFPNYPAALLFGASQQKERKATPTPPITMPASSFPLTGSSSSSLPLSKSPSNMSTGQPASKRQRLDETCSSIQKKKEALEVKRLELEVRHWEMKNEQLAMHWKLTQEKMEKEIKFMEESEARAKEKHELEMCKLRTGQNGRL